MGQQHVLFTYAIEHRFFRKSIEGHLHNGFWEKGETGSLFCFGKRCITEYCLGEQSWNKGSERALNRVSEFECFFVGQKSSIQRVEVK